MNQDEIILCKCHNSEHQIIFKWFDDEIIGGQVYVDILINPEYKWWKRIKEAIKYIFGYRSRYGMFDEFILDKKDVPKLEKIVEYLKKTK